MAYSGTIYRGIDYSPTWVSWSASAPQLFDSDFANDAFASLWANTYQPNAGPSAPVNNGTGPSNYRGDLNTIASDGFNLVRLYDWDAARGTAVNANPATAVGLDHINFLDYAGPKPNGLGLKVVVPVSDFYLNNDPFSWNNGTPDTTSYSFTSAPTNIQNDFNQFVASITDPVTKKIHTAIHSIAVGNEGDIGTGIGPGTDDNINYGATTASQFLARTIWWIYNLNKVVNGATLGNGTTVQLTATISNADAGNPSSKLGGWFNDLINGVTSTTPTPNGWPQGGNFGATVTGLSVVDPNYANYYYNSVNVAQSNLATLASSISSQVLKPYDTGSTSLSVWPYATFNVPLMLMEVFNNNRSSYSPTTNQATAYVNQATDIQGYLTGHSGTTNLMGYNFFEFNDEPTQPNPQMGLYQYPPSGDVPAGASTGTTSFYYNNGNGNAVSFPVDPLTATPGPTGSPTGTTLASAWQATFAATYSGTAGNDKLVGTATAESFRGAAGNDGIDGANGYDIALYGQNARAYTLKATAGSATITVQDKVGTDGTDTLTNVEQIRFTNGTIDPSWILKAAALPAAQILKIVDLYTAGLNRAPDALGLDFYASRLADGASISTISKAIFGSAEAAPIFSTANSNPVFVNLVYQNALGRAPDAAGLSYWVNELATGHLARTDLVTTLIAGASATDKQYIANKEAVGAHFALTAGLNNLTWAQTVESAVNGTAASVTAANAQTDAFAVTAATPATSELVVQIVGLVP